MDRRTSSAPPPFDVGDVDEELFIPASQVVDGAIVVGEKWVVDAGLASPRSAFANGEMSWGDVAFDADLVANVLGDLAGALALDAGDVERGESTSGHQVMIAAEKRHRLGR